MHGLSFQMIRAQTNPRHEAMTCVTFVKAIHRQPPIYIYIYTIYIFRSFVCYYYLYNKIITINTCTHYAKLI